ncbi:MAG: hypothetical protein Q4E51_09465 [Lachnospiraceae bacterium]|nr:hypothetical protein [Lachnospiraceae bacterium]
MKRISFTIIICILTLFVTGCSAKGPLHKKSYVIKKVAEDVPSERYKFDRKEPVPDADVSTEIYYFKSKDRDLEFRAINTRGPAFFESGLYAKALHILYADDVHTLYDDEIKKVLENGGFSTKDNRFNIDSFSDLSNVADTLIKADDIYKEELNYNTIEWMEDNPYDKYRIAKKFINDKGKERGYTAGGVSINGSWDKKSLYDYLCFQYATYILEGDFSDPTVPKSVMDMAHTPSLKHVYINGIEVSETGYQNTKVEGAYNNSESSYYADYCYKLRDYVLTFNTATVPEDCGPHATEEYLDVLAPGYEVEYKKGIYKWQYNDSSYESHATENKDGYVDSFIIYKDGKDCQIPFVKCGEWTSPVHGVYSVGITVHDFAKLFDLTVEIDEENESVYFMSYPSIM